MKIKNDTLYPIGDAAYRTGLSVSAIRFYSDEGIIPPTEVTPAGHRWYDVETLARLEFVRTLRDLGTGLDQIRGLLSGETTLRYLLAQHLETVEQQEADLRIRRAVLRALVSEKNPEERIILMRKLVAMPDTDRERLLDEFWREVGADLPAQEVERVRDVAPRLPDDPTASQLQAWITLAELLQDAKFRTATRKYVHETYATEQAAMIGAPAVQGFISEAGEGLMPKLIAAHRSGLPFEAPHAGELATQLVRQAAGAVGASVSEELWDRIGAGFPLVGQAFHEALDDPKYQETHGRYLSLIATINGNAPPDAGLVTAAVSESNLSNEAAMTGFGEWLSGAIHAARPSFENDDFTQSYVTSEPKERTGPSTEDC